MLVLSRKVNERLVIGDSIVVTIVRIDGQAVRVGIEAPPHVTILRDELVGGVGPAQSDRVRAGSR